MIIYLDICFCLAKIFSAIFNMEEPMNLLSLTATPLPFAFASVPYNIFWLMVSILETVSSLISL